MPDTAHVFCLDAIDVWHGKGGGWFAGLSFARPFPLMHHLCSVVALTKRDQASEAHECNKGIVPTWLVVGKQTTATTPPTTCKVSDVLSKAFSSSFVGTRVHANLRGGCHRSEMSKSVLLHYFKTKSNNEKEKHRNENRFSPA